MMSSQVIPIAILFASIVMLTAADMIKSEVKMNLEEFQEIFSSARLMEAEQRVLDQKKRNEAEHQRKVKELDEAIRQSKISEEKERMTDHLALFPDNYKVLTQTAAGLFNASDPSSGVEGDVASFDIELMIRVMSSKWTSIPIANTTSMVASNWELSWMPEGEIAGKKTSDNSPTSSTYTVLDPITDPQAMFLVREEQQVLATNISGLFRVRFNAHSRVRKDRKLHSVSLSSLLYPISDASMRLCSGSIDALPDKGLAVKELSINPTSAVLRVQPEEDGCANIQMILPLTTYKFEVRWLDIVDAPKEKKIKGKEEGAKAADDEQPEESLVTATHSVMHTVEEGVIRSRNTINFETSADTLNSVDFVVHCAKGTRVTSVSGYALSRWTAGPYNSTEKLIPVRAYFKTSNLDSSISLQVDTEYDTDTALKMQELQLPRIECVDVLRQSGDIGVIKAANNVELHVSSAKGLARAESTDISSQLRLNTHHPIMFSYKYLNPQYELQLRSTSHTAMDTLEAVVDRVHYEALLMDSHVMHSLLVMMKSSKKQYLEIHGIPNDAAMFTLIVNGVQTKPVRAENAKDTLLIPLLVGLNEAANEGLGVKSSIELRYFSTHDPLGEEGSLDFPLPRVTLPISVVTTELRLPTTYAYNFTGDFGNRGADRLKYPVPSAFSYVKGKRIVPKGYKFSRLDDMMDDEDDTSKDDSTIQVDIPQTGRSYFFQRLLVVGTPLSLGVGYSPPLPKATSSFWDSLASFFV